MDALKGLWDRAEQFFWGGMVLWPAGIATSPGSDPDKAGSRFMATEDQLQQAHRRALAEHSAPSPLSPLAFSH